MINPQSGNMYPFITGTWNAVKGKCPHNCMYCYMKKWGEQKPMRFSPNDMKDDFGKGNFIFIGSSCDMWANSVPLEWIIKIVNKCLAQPHNKYLLQSKNPARFTKYNLVEKLDAIFACTIESNRNHPVSDAPLINERVEAMARLTLPKMISIEPILEFDLDKMVEIIDTIKPIKISIGADSQGCLMEEPPTYKLEKLIQAIRERKIDLCVKSNLKRLMDGV